MGQDPCEVPSQSRQDSQPVSAYALSGCEGMSCGRLQQSDERTASQQRNTTKTGRCKPRERV
eukprot:2217202-Rhodomonas_salina.2